MSRATRMPEVDAFANNANFDEQLYGALRNSPWWMISIAVHLLIFVVAGLLETGEPPKPEPPLIEAVQGEPPPDEEPVLPPDENPNPIDSQELPVPDPVDTEDPIEHDNSADTNNEDMAAMAGETFGDANKPFDGPSTNGAIGTGGSAGGGMGPGGAFDGRKPSGGGSPRNDAVLDALRWLKAHQSPNGSWEAAGFMKWCDFKRLAPGKQADGAGKSQFDVGVTGLALCAFLGAGYSNRGQHEFKITVQKGLRYLRNVQDPEGCFGTRSGPNFIYNHATAALAMVEAYGMTESPIHKGAAQRALDFIGLSRNPYFVWRYGVKPGANDTSVTGWMMMALKSAQIINKSAENRGRQAPLVIDELAFQGIEDWLDKMTDDYGRVGYMHRGSGPARPKELVDRFPAAKSEAMTAVGVLARIFIGQDPARNEHIKRGAELCAKLPPKWDENDGSVDMYYWYYGALAMFQVGSKPWKIWRKAMDEAIVGTQRKDTSHCEYKGSWDPVGPWGHDGGRVYSTALMAMCLQVYYRYGRVFGTR